MVLTIVAVVLLSLGAICGVYLTLWLVDKTSQLRANQAQVQLNAVLQEQACARNARITDGILDLKLQAIRQLDVAFQDEEEMWARASWAVMREETGEHEVAKLQWSLAKEVCEKVRSRNCAVESIRRRASRTCESEKR